MFNGKGWINNEAFQILFRQGMIVDARAGGLVVGRSHDEGNIFMFQEVEEGKYFVPGSLEGGEYVLNFDAYRMSYKRIEEINNEKCDAAPIEYVENTETLRILNTVASPFDKFLLIDPRGQFIINRHSTARHLDELQTINGAVNAYSFCGLNILELSAQNQN